MRHRIATTTLAGLLAVLILATSADACCRRKARGCGGHRGRYVTYNGSNFATYPAGPYSGPGMDSPPYGAPQAGPYYGQPQPYAPTQGMGLMPPPPPMGS